MTPDVSGDATLCERLERVAAGDVEALGELYRSHGALAFRSAMALLANRADAEDVVHDVFIRLPAATQGFVGSAAQFPAWLRTLALRQALMLLRSGRRRREVSVEGVSSLFARSDSTLERLSLMDAVDRLPADLRTVYALKEIEGCDHSHIADLLGISVANSEVRLHRARRQLRQLLGGANR